jgi:hypothetical protein
MATKIKSASAKVAGPVAGKNSVYIETTVEFEAGAEWLKIMAVVPDEGTEAQQVARGKKRTRELAQRFIDFPS